MFSALRPRLFQASRPLARPYATVRGPLKPPSPHIGFYHLWGRPIAKVFLMAFITYQGAYYFWMRGEQWEIERELRNEVGALEAQAKEAIKARIESEKSEKKD